MLETVATGGIQAQKNKQKSSKSPKGRTAVTKER
jgi:hypothetical protein